MSNLSPDGAWAPLGAPRQCETVSVVACLMKSSGRDMMNLWDAENAPEIVFLPLAQG